jgi:hypothetical protein
VRLRPLRRFVLGRFVGRILGRFVPRGRRLRLFAGNLLAAFGAVSAVIQFVGQLFPRAFPQPGRVTLGAVALCVTWAAVRAYPRTRVHREFTRPDMTVVIERGDLFDRPEHLVVGFSDTFDTTVGAGGPVSAASVQGQLLDRLYGGNPEHLDRDLAAALRGVRPQSRERRDRKPLGKLTRYPVGTVAALGGGPRLVFAVAYSRLGNDGVAHSSVEDLWFSLNRLWDAVYQHGQQDSVAVPLIGAGLARLSFLGEEDILRLIVLSFVVRSRERRICRELRVVVRPGDLRKIDMPEVAAFLQALGAAADT